MMAGEKCVDKFWDAMDKQVTKKGTVCKTSRDKVVNHNGIVKYDLWKTTIVKGNKSNRRLDLNTGGWATKLTKDRMNKIIRKKGCHIKQEKNKWKVNGRNFPSSGKFTIKGSCKR